MKHQSRSISRFAILAPAFVVIISSAVSVFGQEAPEAITVGSVKITGLPEDWTHHRLVFSNAGSEEEAIRNGTYVDWLRIVNDPRYVIHQLKRQLPAQGPAAEDVAKIEKAAQTDATTASLNRVQSAAAQPGVTGLTADALAHAAKTKTKKITKDWNESLGSTTAPSYATYPAKWSFSTSIASCANDFVIYPTGQAGSSSQASIAAYYELYGTSGPNGTGCGAGSSGKNVPSVDWAYNTSGTIALAPVFSIGGSQIAFIQTSSSVASLVLLTFPLIPPGTGTLSSPKVPTSETGANYPGCTAPCMTSITLSGSPNDTLSNPWYDYVTDSIYVGASDGKLHKFKPVFNGTPAEVTTSGWPVTLDTSNSPASPVYDPASGCVFVGDTGGYLYSVNSGNSGTVCTSTTGSLKGTSTQLDQTYGVRDAPLVDSTAAMVYVFAGNDTSGSNGVFQLATSFNGGSGTEAILAQGSGATGTTAYQLDGTFDNTYFTSSNSSGNIYVCGTAGPGTLYQVAISSNTMGAVTTGPVLADSSYYGRCSPVTEFFNTGTGQSNTATGTARMATDPSNWAAGTTVTIGSTTYAFVSSLTAVNQVLLVTSHSTSTNETDTAKNLEAVINNTSSECSSSGCIYTGQTANASVTATQATHVVTLTAKTSGASGDFTLSTNQTSEIAIIGGNNGATGTDYVFLSAFAGTRTGCTDNSNDGCVMSFNVTTFNNFSSSLSPLGTLNTSAVTYSAPTGGLIIDNLLTSPTGASNIYFQTIDTNGSSPCTGICAVQASQAAP